MHSRDFGLQSSEARVRVAQSLEWWTCVQATRVQSPSADYLFLLNCVLFNDFIFIMMDLNVFRFLFVINKIIAAFFSTNIELFSVNCSLNSDDCRIAGIKDMPPKHPCSSTALEFTGSLCRHQRNAAISMIVYTQHLAMHQRF